MPQWESHIRLLTQRSTSCHLWRNKDCMDVDTELYIQSWMNPDYINAIPEWLGWIPENSNPISDFANLREKVINSMCWLWAGLAKCPVLLLCCAEGKLFQTRLCLCWPASATSTFFRFGIQTLHRRMQRNIKVVLFAFHRPGRATT